MFVVIENIYVYFGVSRLRSQLEYSFTVVVNFLSLTITHCIKLASLYSLPSHYV